MQRVGTGPPRRIRSRRIVTPQRVDRAGRPGPDHRRRAHAGLAAGSNTTGPAVGAFPLHLARTGCRRRGTPHHRCVPCRLAALRNANRPDGFCRRRRDGPGFAAPTPGPSPNTGQGATRAAGAGPDRAQGIGQGTGDAVSECGPTVPYPELAPGTRLAGRRATLPRAGRRATDRPCSAHTPGRPPTSGGCPYRRSIRSDRLF